MISATFSMAMEAWPRSRFSWPAFELEAAVEKKPRSPTVSTTRAISISSRRSPDWRSVVFRLVLMAGLIVRVLGAFRPSLLVVEGDGVRRGKRRFHCLEDRGAVADER